jgi:spermidine synthase
MVFYDKKVTLSILTFLTAFSSHIYSLSLAHLLVAHVGGFYHHYVLSSSVFVFSLGLGSYLAPLFAAKKVGNLLWIVEFSIAVLACGSIFFIIKFKIESTIIIYSLLFLIGLLSGLELPLIHYLYDSKEKTLEVLSIDYWGMFLASVIFAAVLIPLLGVMYTAYLAGFLNFIAGGIAWALIKKLV